jgi:putative spermidine/putrescine transport system ATP-binding protein
VEIYERPRTAFVAGFVGVSNLIGGDLAERLTGQRDSFAIRPEKIRLAAPTAPVADGMLSVVGQVAEAIYLGMHTRYQVQLEDGARLTVAAQNGDDSPPEAPILPGSPVRLLWRREHIHPLAG